MRVFLGNLIERPDGPQFLISVHDDGVVTSATRSSSDPAEPWSTPVELGEAAR